MILSKITPLLALALSESDGPIKVIVKFNDKRIMIVSLTKTEIAQWSEQDSVIEIKIGTRLKNRRKDERPGHEDRRWDLVWKK